MKSSLRLINEDDGVGIEIAIVQQDVEDTNLFHALCCCPDGETLITVSQHPASDLLIEFKAPADEMPEFLSGISELVGTTSLCEGLCKIVVGLIKTEGSIDFPGLKDDVLE